MWPFCDDKGQAHAAVPACDTLPCLAQASPLDSNPTRAAAILSLSDSAEYGPLGLRHARQALYQRTMFPGPAIMSLAYVSKGAYS